MIMTTAAMTVAAKDRRDQVSGNNKKYIDPDEAARQKTTVDVIQHHRKNGDPAKTVDFWAVVNWIGHKRHRRAESSGRSGGPWLV
jgi:hypothetical protein